MCIKLGYTNPSIRATFLLAWFIIFRIHILFTWKNHWNHCFLPSSCSSRELVSSAVHLLIRSLWLCSAGTGGDEVDSRIHKPGKESKFWFKLLKSYVTLKPENPCWNGLWWFSRLKNCIASMKKMAQSSSSTKTPGGWCGNLSFKQQIFLIIRSWVFYLPAETMQESYQKC